MRYTPQLVMGAVIFGVPLAMLAGVIGIAAFGRGTVHVVAPEDAGMTVQLDGEPPVAVNPGEHRLLGAGSGAHQLVVTVGGVRTEERFELRSGLSEVFVGAPSRCYAMLDITGLAYSRGIVDRLTDESSGPRVVEAFRGEAIPQRRPIHTWVFSDTDLPDKLRNGQRAVRPLEIDCADVDLPKEELAVKMISED